MGGMDHRTVRHRGAYRSDIIAFGIKPSSSYCESFNSKLRDELLDGEIFYSLEEARIIVEGWRRHHNETRLHSPLGYRPPAPAVLFPERPATLTQPASPGARPLVQRSAMN